MKEKDVQKRVVICKSHKNVRDYHWVALIVVTEGLFLQEVLRGKRTVFHDGAGWGHCPKQNGLYLAIVRRKKVEYRKGTTSSSWPEFPAWSTPIYHSNTICYHPPWCSQGYISSLNFRFLPSQALSCLRAFALAALAALEIIPIAVPFPFLRSHTKCQRLTETQTTQSFCIYIYIFTCELSGSSE